MAFQLLKRLPLLGRADLAGYRKRVDRINQLEREFESLTDDGLKIRTDQFKERIVGLLNEKDFSNLSQELKKKAVEEATDLILEEAFAAVREAAKRTIGQRHFDVQLIGGLVLHQGKIAEMKTGEGKTLAATLPLYLNALLGRGAHLVTVNDYLANRDAAWMGPIYQALGLTVSSINQQGKSFIYDAEKDQGRGDQAKFDPADFLKPISRREAYQADITYGTNNEFGFDYLRDNMVFDLSRKVQRELSFAIVDEVDSILIDEARTPLIISAPTQESASLYQKFASIAAGLKIGADFVIDEKDRIVTLTDRGVKTIEELLSVENVYDPEHILLVHHMEEALKAEYLFQRDKDYIVRDSEIVIVDEFTGRLMNGRRYSEGLHQAIEAKEGVEIQRESDTLATISFQNLFRLYEKLSGMTGTAKTEEEEFFRIYGLEALVAPTHRPMVRKDESDRIYKTREAKLRAIVEDIKERNQKGQPILVGTISVERNEELSRLLTQVGVEHEILNAKNHEREAQIIAKAGEVSAVTVATNMAGRGTDIVPSKEAIELGGLYVLGTERHESRRIDNQLRGRTGRQGDPGVSRFYVSMDDDLMRIFGGERLKTMMERLGLPDDQPIENRLVSKSIESAQRRVEGHNFDIRKHLVEYDDVINRHRQAIYGLRSNYLKLIGQRSVEDLKLEVLELSGQVASSIRSYSSPEEGAMRSELEAIFGKEGLDLSSEEALRDSIKDLFENRFSSFGEANFIEIFRAIFLQTIDNYWIEHLNAMQILREGIGLRGYGQRDPLVEYRREGRDLFESLLRAINQTAIRGFFHVEIKKPSEPVEGRVEVRDEDKLNYQGANETLAGGGFAEEEADLAGSRSEGSRSSPDQAPGRTPDESGLRVTTTVRKAQADYPLRSSLEERAEAADSVKTLIGRKVGRNEPCPCGSGKKFKKCHGR